MSHMIPLPVADLELGPPPSELSSEAAFRIFPIAHQYDMQLLQRWCRQAIRRAPLDLWPSAPIASSQVPQHPGLVHWLALADSKQCTPLVEACLSQLLCQESDKAIHEALASPHLRQLIDGLRPETKTSIICKMAGLPLGFQVPMMPNEVLNVAYAGITGIYSLWLSAWHGCMSQQHSFPAAPSPSVLPDRDVYPRSTGCSLTFHSG